MMRENYSVVGVHHDARNGIYCLRFDLFRDPKTKKFIYNLIAIDERNSGYDDQQTTNERMKLITHDSCIECIFNLFDIEQKYSNDQYHDVIGNLPRPIINKIRNRKGDKPIRVKYVDSITCLEDSFSLMTDILGEERINIGSDTVNHIENILYSFTKMTNKDLKEIEEGKATIKSCILAFFNSVCFLENTLIEHDMV